ncbi:hypothetical protein NKH72_21675 [Mesorhizobium sp. M0955]|uniref:hypothetical protein n=1 Tax=Mesorhizobium sp. M0955 TaxID=2957033 RepID=UPI003337E298
MSSERIKELENGYLAIMKALVAGKIGDDTVWFSETETLFDYCASHINISDKAREAILNGEVA